MKTNTYKTKIATALLEKDFITDKQLDGIEEYQRLGIFSLHTELRLLLYSSVLLFTSGIGILIYQNIDSIGRDAIILCLLFIIALSLYFCVKKAKGFHKEEVVFENPIYDYLVLLVTILSCIFIGYLQFQYNLFGKNYGIATLVPTIISFCYAYYFDNKSALSIAVSGLAACIGLTVTPQKVLDTEFYSNDTLAFSAIGLGLSLILWTNYSPKIRLKTHFNFLYLTFALHLICIATISKLSEKEIPTCFLFAFLLAGTTYYFYKISKEYNAISLFVFASLYGYVGFNVLLFKVLDSINFNSFWELLIYLFPAYFIGSIFLFIQSVKKFKQQKNN
jgi:hypothetical protein